MAKGRLDPETRAMFRKMDQKLRDYVYRSVEFLAVRGLHAQVIADCCGLAKWEVYRACRQMKVRLRDYRDGKGEVGSVLVARTREVVKSAKKGRKKSG